MQSNNSRHGFTIVELLVVVVIVGILATVVIVAYNGIRTRAEDASLQSETEQVTKKVLAYKVLNSDQLPTDMTAAGVIPGSGHDIYYRVTPDGRNFCIAVNITGSAQRVFSATSTNSTPKSGTCQGYILVPGNTALGTNDFWVMKYEAKNVNNVATSQAASTPWVSISQTDAISNSTAACDGCHLISEAEWMTLAGNVLGVSSNWSGGSVGAGYIYSGHNDNSPANALAATTTDSDGYNGTGNTTGSNQRRTLTLSNGEVVWDFAGNGFEWTQLQIGPNQQPGFTGENTFSWKEWTNASLQMNGLPVVGRPSSLASTNGLASVISWSSTQGVGQLHSNYGTTSTRVGMRGGSYLSGSVGGVLATFLGYVASGSGADTGFRVAR